MSRVAFIDSVLSQWIASLPHPAWLDAIMLGASLAGTKAAIWIAAGVWLFARKPALRPGVWQLVLALIVTSLLVDGIIKEAVERPRPFTALVDVRVVGVRPSTSSFPSGHAASSVAGAFVLTRLWPQARAALWALAALIAFSRVYLGVHYPLDVAAGALLGLGCAYFVLGGARSAFAQAGLKPCATEKDCRQATS